MTQLSRTSLSARLWEISENLHRAELSALERDEQIALWVKLNAEKVSQVATPGGEQPSFKGIRAAERELGIRRDDASRAVKVASLPEEVKNAAREVGLDDNRSALLEAAKHEGIENQIASIRERAEAKVMRLADDPLNDESGKTDTVSDLKQAGSQIRNGCENHQETRHRVGFPGA